VLLTHRDREAEKASGTEVQTSEMILKNIRVLAIDQTVGEKDGQKVITGKTATLELSPRQVETLTLAQKLGSISLALRSITDATTDGKDASADDDNTRHSTVNVIRFGVPTTTTPK
jgi:pilus assembly protein CpaB